MKRRVPNGTHGGGGNEVSTGTAALCGSCKNFSLTGRGANSTAKDALRQIEEKGYHVSYEADSRRVVKVGVVFDTEKRTLGDWLVC